tara:strand:- start:423 stop:680 length:258 start_codon:yes stop_codon:yes gene_type:complete
MCTGLSPCNSSEILAEILAEIKKENDRENRELPIAHDGDNLEIQLILSLVGDDHGVEIEDDAEMLEAMFGREGLDKIREAESGFY